MKVLRSKNLRKRLSRHRSNQRCFLEVNEGETLVILGASGIRENLLY